MLKHGTTYRAHSNTPDCTCLACQDFFRPKSVRRTHPEACNCPPCQNAKTVISSKNAETVISSRNAESREQRLIHEIYEVYTTIDSETGKRYTYGYLAR